MAAEILRFVHVYLSHDKKRNIWEWSSWYGMDNSNGLGIPTPHKQTFARNGVRYYVQSEYPLPEADALQIVRSLYEFEFATGRVK